MQQVTIGPNQAGQRLDKFLHKYLPEAGMGFLYKMLRKKNIILNGKKAEGKELLQEGDVVSFYFAEETFAKFAGRTVSDAEGTSAKSQDNTEKTAGFQRAYRQLGAGIPVIYEDGNIIVLNKPAGLLTQKAAAGDISLNEWLIGYLLDTGAIDEEELHSFKPSVCNRLDRNTSGLVLCGKSLAGSQYLSRIIRERSLAKFYRTVCVGELQGECLLEGYLIKDVKSNQVRIVKEPEGKKGNGKAVEGGAGPIRTAYRPLAAGSGYTLLEVELITGKPHQIRAHLASIGHPVIGDRKYGDRRVNAFLQAEYGLENQLLHAHRVVFPDGRELTAPEPEIFREVVKGLSITSKE